MFTNNLIGILLKFLSPPFGDLEVFEMFVFILAYIVPVLIMALISPIAWHFLAGWLGCLLLIGGFVWEVISVIKSIRSVNGGWRGVVVGPGEFADPLNPGTHWIWLGIRSLRQFRIEAGANIIQITMNRKLAFTDSTGTLKGATAYVTVIDPVSASRCQNWRLGVKDLVADTLGEWLQSVNYRSDLPGRNGEELSFFSQNASDLMAGWGLKCLVSLHVEP